MSVAAILPPSVSKEVRALALPWLACAACMLVIGVTDAPYLFGPLAIIAYLVGTVALGALSIGHEYTGRTLSLLLTLPTRRERLLTTKLGVLTVMLLTMWAVADALLFSGMPAPAAEKRMIALIPLACALFLAPWLTMVCRSAIAGTVFALTIPGLLMVVGELLGVALYGHGPVMEAFRMTVVWFGTLGLCAVGAVMSWRMFTRLEAIEGPGQDVRLPQWLRAGRAADALAPRLTKHNPFWLLVMKELRLQQLPLALTTLYAFEWIAVVSLASVSDPSYGYLFSGLTLLHVGLLPILIGSFASAGERQLDTLQSQILLPMAAWKQWALKVAVVFVLAIVLAIGLPALLLSLSRSAHLNLTPHPEWEVPMIAVVLLASGSLYISSLCRSGLWALLMSMPAVVGSVAFLQLAFKWVAFPVYFAVRQFIENPLPRLLPTYFLPPRVMSYLLIAGFVAAIALRFAFINHRSADRPAKRVWVQMIVMATFVAVGIAAGAAWQAFRSG
jgi:hypothetical protein